MSDQITALEAAKILGVSSRQVYELAAPGGPIKIPGCYRFEFNRVIKGRRVRVRKYLPKTWTQVKADAFEKKKATD